MAEILSNFISTSSDLTMSEALSAMAFALIFGLVITVVYMVTHKDNYQQSFALTLAMLPVIMAMIILFVGSNITRAFSLAGTLSIIRFRSAPGDPQDIGYIFFDIAAGLACGVGMYIYGGIFVAVVSLFMLVIWKTNFGARKEQARLLKIVIPENLDYQGAFDDLFEKYTKSIKMLKVRTTDLGSLYELSYNVKLADGADEKAFIDDLRCRNGNLNIVLSLCEDTVYGKA
jgi:hypothetical protein